MSIVKNKPGSRYMKTKQMFLFMFGLCPLPLNPLSKS